jgi:hypothetical protein
MDDVEEEERLEGTVRRGEGMKHAWIKESLGTTELRGIRAGMSLKSGPKQKFKAINCRRRDGKT